MATATATTAPNRASRLGWYEDNRTWYYAHAGGVIGPHGGEENSVPSIIADLDAFTLPDPPATTNDLRSAVLASIGLMDAVPDRVAIPLLGAAYRAVLGYSRASVCLVGRRGTGKTLLAAFAAQHFSSIAYTDELPFSAAGTPLWIEQARHLVGDMLLPLDDLAPDQVARIAWSQFNRQAKARVSRTGSLIKRVPRSMPLVTAEPADWPEHVYSRVVLVDVEEQDALPAAPLVHTGVEPRAALTSALVRHYAPVKGSLDELLRTKSEAIAAELPTANGIEPGFAARQSELVADLAAGWWAMLEMAVLCDALSPAESDELWDRVMGAFSARN